MSGNGEEASLTIPKFSSFKPKQKVTGASSDGGGGEAENPGVPKFSSFKPKGSEVPEEKRRREKKDEDRDDRKRRHRSGRDHDHHSKRRRHESRRREGERRRSRSPGERPERHIESRSRGDKDVKSDLFFFDKKGDPLIIKYGGIERSKIPKYYRYGAGRVLGTTGRLIIHREGPRDQFSLRMPGEGSGLFKDKDGLRTKRSKLKREALSLRPRKKGAEDEGESYLALASSKKRDQRAEESESSDGDELPSYRSIELKSKASLAAIDSDSSDGSESEDEEPALDQSNPLKWRSIQLNRQVKEHPEDTDAWIELVAHQDTLLRGGESLDHKVLENEVHSYAEIKVSMLGSALSNTTNPRDRNRVLNYLMPEGLKVWDSKTAAKKWSEVLEDEQHNFTLWKTHLDFCTSNIASFQYDEVKLRLITRLHQATSRSLSEPRQNDWSEAVYVFLRATRFIHDAGYKELAVAAWQALLEITFFKPQEINNNQEALDTFQDFWESEVPRIGEADAQGWGQFVDSSSETNAPEPLKTEAQEDTSGESYKAWANSEHLRAENAWLPARTMDEGTDDDPFRVVMYSDLESLLFFIPESVMPRVGHQLLDAFLIFSGYPPCFCSDDWIETASQDQFLTGARGSMDTNGAWDAKEDGLDEAPRKPPAFTVSDLHAKCTPELLFPGGNWFNFLGTTTRSHTIDSGWMRSAIGQLVHRAGVEGLASYYLSSSSLDPSSSVKKLAKSLLKKFPTNTGLYNAYALAQYAQGNRDTAIKVLSSASDISKGDANSPELLLWRTWAWVELEAGNKPLAIKRLCSSVDDLLRKSPDDQSEVSGSYILKARQVFSSHTGDRQTRAECLALLAYLTTDGCTEPSSAAQGNISAAMDSIDNSSYELKFHGEEGAAAHEGLLQFAARLLYFNATRGPFRRAYMTEKLVKFIGYFPQNTILLSLLEWSDSSLRVVDETRALLYDKIIVPPNDCVSSRIFAIQHELNCGNTNTTKAAFEHAVTSDACKSSVQVWISYIRFCQSHKELRPKAKEIFYRALRHCPWSKDIMMEAFGTLIRDMESEELRSVYNTMTSKGIRIHVDMEEFMEKQRTERDCGAMRQRR